MKEINININKAKIMSFSVELVEDMPEVSATIGLFSGDKKISTFSLRTQSYYSESIQFEIPTSMINPIIKIAEELETILIIEANKSLLQLENGGENE